MVAAWDGVVGGDEMTGTLMMVVEGKVVNDRDRLLNPP